MYTIQAARAFQGVASQCDIRRCRDRREGLSRCRAGLLERFADPLRHATTPALHSNGFSSRALDRKKTPRLVGTDGHRLRSPNRIWDSRSKGAPQEQAIPKKRRHEMLRLWRRRRGDR